MSLASQVHKTKELGDICEFLSGGTPSKDREDYWGGDVPWVTARDLKTTHLEETGLRLTAAGARTLKCAPQGAIVILVRGMTLFKDIPVAVLRKPMCFNQDIKALVVDAEHDGMFVAYQLIARKSFIQRLVDSAGHGTGRLDTGLLKAVPLRFPTLPEQQKIAAFLGAVDARLAALAAKQAALGRFKAGLMQKLFSQQLRFTREDGGAFPDWQEKRLGSFIEVINGLTYSPRDISDTGLLVLRSSNVRDATLALDDNVYVNLSVSDERLTQPGDILLCVRNGSQRLIGKSALIPDNIPRATHGAFMSLLRGNESHFVYQLLQTQLFFREVHKNLGATINSINGSDLKKFKFILPTDPKERTKIADALSAMDAKIQAVADQVSKLQTFKKGLLQQMFV